MSQTMRPILFSGPMIQAILKGHKTQTRRVMKPQPVLDGEGMWHWKDCQWMDDGLGFPQSGIEYHSPYNVGDVLWVRETWANACLNGGPDGFIDAYAYKADGAITYFSGGRLKTSDCRIEELNSNAVSGWRPSIHMPKNAARLFLRVTGVRVERLQVIENIAAEGITLFPADNRLDPRYFFIKMWDSLMKPADRDKCGWDANPWVWRISFVQCEKPQRWP